MNKSADIKTAVIYETDGRIGRTVSSAIARLILDYARQYPDVLENNVQQAQNKEPEHGK